MQRADQWDIHRTLDEWRGLGYSGIIIRAARNRSAWQISPVRLGKCDDEVFEGAALLIDLRSIANREAEQVITAVFEGALTFGSFLRIAWTLGRESNRQRGRVHGQAGFGESRVMQPVPVVKRLSEGREPHGG